MSLSLTFAAFLLAGAAPDPQPAPAAEEAKPSRIFVSPSGKPYRNTEGPYPSAAWFAEADVNGDGKLTALEMALDAQVFFETLDKDGNGSINGAEIERYEVEIAPEVGVARGRAPNPGANAETGRVPGVDPNLTIRETGSKPSTARVPAAIQREIPRGAGWFSFFNVPQPILRADTDLNGIVTASEHRRWVQEQFSGLDSEKRGYLTYQELPETPIQKRGGLFRKIF